MKILLFSHTAAVTGGAEKCLLEYVEVLKARGHKCKVVVPYKGPMTKALSQLGIAWTVIGYGWATRPHRKVNQHKIMASTGNSLVKVFQEVEKYKPEVIITNTAVIPWGLYAGKAFKIPTILLIHEIISEKDPSLRMVPGYSEYREILNQNADYVIYNSQFVRAEFIGDLTIPQTSKDVLYPLPPLDKNKIDDFFKDNIIKKDLKIAIFGALSPRKNQLEAAQALKLLIDQGITNVRLDFYGDVSADPSYTKALRKYVRDSGLAQYIKIKGFAEDVYKRMNEYNVILSTATYEPFGRTIIEGQLFGRIVITNNTGGGLELVDDMGTGLVYDSGSPEQLAGKIAWIINNKQHALSLGVTAKQQQFDKYITSSRYDALLDAIVYFKSNDPQTSQADIFNPIMCLFQYNHQLNNRYRHLYRLTHNRITYPVKNMIVLAISKAKKIVKRFL